MPCPVGSPRALEALDISRGGKGEPNVHLDGRVKKGRFCRQCGSFKPIQRIRSSGHGYHQQTERPNVSSGCCTEQVCWLRHQVGQEMTSESFLTATQTHSDTDTHSDSDTDTQTHPQIHMTRGRSSFGRMSHHVARAGLLPCFPLTPGPLLLFSK